MISCQSNSREEEKPAELNDIQSKVFFEQLGKKNQLFYPKLELVSGVFHIHAVAHKFGIIRTEKDFEGLFVKGVGDDYNWSYLKHTTQS